MSGRFRDYVDLGWKGRKLEPGDESKNLNGFLQNITMIVNLQSFCEITMKCIADILSSDALSGEYMPFTLTTGSEER